MHLLVIYCSVNFFHSDGETFISADDLRINLWNLEISNQSFNIIDVKPTNMEDLTGITSKSPKFSYLF
jgi:serine/threonine-protein phosphatase 2A regulatory subunit B